MEHTKIYEAAARRHGQIGQDVVHDMYVKFGEHVPNEAYLRTCIKHAKPDPIQQLFDSQYAAEEADEVDEQEFQAMFSKVHKAIEKTRDRYTLEVDTFLECKVNGDIYSFSQAHGVSVSVLRKICKFVQYEILTEFNRLTELDKGA